MIDRLSLRKEDLKQLGISAFKAKDYVKSLGYLSLSLEHFPNDMEALEWKVKCFYELRQDEICLKYVNEAEITSAEMMIIEAKVYLDRHDFAKIAECSHKLRTMENEPRLRTIIDAMKAINALNSRYVDLKSKEDYKGATECINELIGRLPFNHNTNKLRLEQLECLLRCGELARCQVIFESLDQYETTAQIFCLKIKLYYYLREEKTYKELIKKGQDLFPRSDSFRQLEAKIDETDFSLKQSSLLIQYKKYAEAIKILTEGLQIDPFNRLANSLFCFKRAIIYRRINAKDQAQNNFNKAIEFNPLDVNIRKERASYNVEEKNYVSAILDYQKLKEIDPDNTQLYQKEIQSLKKLDNKNGKQDFYRILNVQRGSQEEEIKKAYRKLAMSYHPDRNRNKPASEIAQNSYKFMQLTEAYKVLMDPEFRKSYDSSQSFTGQQEPGQYSNSKQEKAHEEQAQEAQRYEEPKEKSDRSSSQSDESDSSSDRSREKKGRYDDGQNRSSFKDCFDNHKQRGRYYNKYGNNYNQYNHYDKSTSRNKYNKPYRNPSFYDRNYRQSKSRYGSRERTY